MYNCKTARADLLKFLSWADKNEGDLYNTLWDKAERGMVTVLGLSGVNIKEYDESELKENIMLLMQYAFYLGRTTKLAEEDYYTVKEVAKRLRYSTAYICYWLAGDKRKGIPPRIRGIKILGGSWRIPKSEYERLIKEGLLPLATSMRIQS